MNQPSYTSGRQDVALLATTVGDAFDATVARHAEREALVVRHQRLRYSWRQLAERVDAYARAFIALGLRPGERLGIWAPNCAEWCITQFASAKVGAVLVNINPAYRSSELEYALKQSGCSWLICADAFKTSDYHAMLGDLLPELARARPGELASERLPELRCSSTSRSTSSTPPVPPASPRAPPSATTTSSTTATWSAKASDSARKTAW